MNFSSWYRRLHLPAAAAALVFALGGYSATTRGQESDSDESSSARSRSDRDDDQDNRQDAQRQDQQRRQQQSQKRQSDDRRSDQSRQQQRSYQYDRSDDRDSSDRSNSNLSRQTQDPRSQSGSRQSANQGSSQRQSSQSGQGRGDQDQSSQFSQQGQSQKGHQLRAYDMGISWEGDDDDDDALVVRRVQQDSALARAGLERGDEILSLNGRRVRSQDEFNRSLTTLQWGSRVPLVVERDGERETLYWTTGRSSQHASYSGDQRDGGQQARAFLGVQLNEDYDDAAVVSQVFRNSPAERAGIRAWDTIVRLNGQPVSSAEDLTEQVAKLQPGDSVQLQIARRQSLNAQVRLGSRDGNQVEAAGYSQREQSQNDDDDHRDRSRRDRDDDDDRSDRRRNSDDNDRSSRDEDSND